MKKLAVLAILAGLVCCGCAKSIMDVRPMGELNSKYHLVGYRQVEERPLGQNATHVGTLLVPKDGTTTTHVTTKKGQGQKQVVQVPPAPAMPATLGKKGRLRTPPPPPAIIVKNVPIPDEVTIVVQEEKPTYGPSIGGTGEGIGIVGVREGIRGSSSVLSYGVAGWFHKEGQRKRRPDQSNYSGGTANAQSISSADAYNQVRQKFDISLSQWQKMSQEQQLDLLNRVDIANGGDGGWSSGHGGDDCH